MDNPILIRDSITHALDPGPAPVVICGSHGGLAAAVFAIQKKVKGAIFNDAGIGLEQAGVAGLKLLEERGILGAAVDAATARIGRGRDTAQGIVSHVNGLAAKAGAAKGQTGAQAARAMARAVWSPLAGDNLEPPEEKETVVFKAPNNRRIVTLDSNSMVRPEHGKAVVLTGSHGGLVGDLPAVKHQVLAAFYNDAGVGLDRAGISRLDWLEEHDIIGATVSADSARIGIGLDTYERGIISHVNRRGREAGIRPGMSAQEAARLALEKAGPAQGESR